MNHALTQDQCELLDMLSSELQEQLEESLSAEHQNPAERLNRQCALLENLGKAAHLIGLHGLGQVCAHLHENMILLSALPEPDDSAALADTWPVYLLDYIQQLSNATLSANSLVDLLAFLRHETWPHPLPGSEQENLAEALLHSTLELPEDDTIPALPTHAEPAMLSLALSDTINPDLYEGLMLELPQQVATFAEEVERWVHTRDKDALAHIQRIAHTIKGSANVVGIYGLANFTHYTEDLLELLARRHLPMTQTLSELLMDIADTLSALLDHLLAGTEPEPTELAVMQALLDSYHQWRDADPAAQADGNLAEETSAYQQTTTTANEALTIQEAPETSYESTSHSQEAPADPIEATKRQDLSAQLRVREDTAQELLRLAGESAIGTNRLLTQSQHVKQQLAQIAQLHRKLTTLSEEFGQLIEVRNLFNQRTGQRAANELDPLELDHYNELHSFFHQLQEVATDTRDAIHQTQHQMHELEELTIEQQRNNRESQNHLLAMRMVPAKSQEARFQRCVRQACRLTGKLAELTLKGGDTPVDSRVLNALTDPLMHLLRNAVDHGIEPDEDRRTAGKADTGHITLEFGAQGQFILVRISDDGAGLDQASIIEKALSLGLKPPTETTQDNEWFQQLIFSPGFSTRTQVSQTSGRGIGLDAVTEAVTRLNGTISLDSQPGNGCVFTLRLPMTVIAEHQLLVASGAHQLAVAARGVEQLLFLEPGALEQEQDRLYYTYEDNRLPVYHLAQVAQLPEQGIINTHEARALLIVQQPGGQRTGVLLEKVLASREMVVKPLSPHTPTIPGIIGATILGDGRVAPVVNIQQLVADYTRQGHEAGHWRQAHQQMQDALRQRRRPLALVVDDSLSTRRSLSQFVSDMGLDVRTAKDGYEAIDALREAQPTVMLVDMEMPRMNGLELTAHLRSQDHTRHIPVIMITSRNTEKHRRLANAAGVDVYLNKPFSEEDLTRYIQASLQSCPATITPS